MRKIRQGPSGVPTDVDISVLEEEFTGDVEVVLENDTYSIYSGPAADITFTAGAIGVEQIVKSYLIPANSINTLTLDASLNVNEIDAFDNTQDYLLVFTMFSGVIVGVGRIVV